MKNLIKKISILLILNSYAFCDVIIKDEKEDNGTTPYAIINTKGAILSKIRQIKFNNEKFYLKTKCMINSLGVFNYRFISESQSESGYENKVLIKNELEKLKEHSFIDEIKKIQDLGENYKYRDFIYEFNIINE